ncbi:DNA cytosine methyltransferase [Dactylosporangium roseum]|uniref:DNA (cytosine-5-)-methyltransferase n=2 Tax=Dactylosporangium roseum TaxID=47989 RepID=A0ABY5ZIW1_9ACTN|nr:DNA cytosine methyltransferase [Dactylosporangium roseum]
MLGMGIEAVLGPLGHVWHAENDPAASKVLAHHYPGVPNLGDITATDWTAVPRADVFGAGFPCQDVSGAGKRAGLGKGTRTGIWSHIADAIDVIRPRLVFLENVEGLHSARADSDLEPCPWCVGDGREQPVLRASGAVLGDLADLGYDARWVTVPASDVGAPHRRKRVFIVAHPADAESLGHWIAGPAGGEGVPSAAVGGAVRPDGVTLLPTPMAKDDGKTPEAHMATGAAMPGGARSTITSLAVLARADFKQPHGSRDASESAAAATVPTPMRRDCRAAGPADASRNSPSLSAISYLLPTPNAALGRQAGAPSARVPRERREHPDRTFGLDDAVALLPSVARGVGNNAGPAPRATDGSRGGPNQRGSSGDLMLPSAVMLLPTPTVADSRGSRNATASRSEDKVGVNNDGWTLSDIAFAERWGEYAPAIARWEQVLDRPAPHPTESGSKGQPRLAPRFVEWMMGLPDGWVCAVPGLSRNDMLRILGNGVVWQQAAYAYRRLLSLDAAVVAA